MGIGPTAHIRYRVDPANIQVQDFCCLDMGSLQNSTENCNWIRITEDILLTPSITGFGLKGNKTRLDSSDNQGIHIGVL